MQEEVWFDNGNGLKFVEYLGEGSDEQVKSIGIKFNNALSSDIARKSYTGKGNVIFVIDGDEVVANTFFETERGVFPFFLGPRNIGIDDERYLHAFYNFLDSRGASDQFLKSCSGYGVDKEFVEGLVEKFSKSPQRVKPKL